MRMYERRESIIHRITPEVCSVISVPDFCRATVEEIGRLMEVDRCCLAPVGVGSSYTVSYEFRRTSSVPSCLEQTIELPSDGDPIDRPLTFGGGSPETAAHADWSIRAGMSSQLVMPIRARDDLLALLSLGYCKRKYDWSKMEIDFLRSLTGLVAIAFHYTRLYSDMASEANISRTLLEIANEINSRVDFDETLRSGVEKAVLLFGSDFGCISLISRDRCHLSFHALVSGNGKEQPLLSSDSIRLEEPVDNRSVLSSRRIRLVELSDGGEAGEFYRRNLFSAQSVLTAPVTIDGVVSGNLHLGWTDSSPKPGSDEFRLIEGIANQLAMVMERDRLSSEVTRLKHELDTVRASQEVVGRSEVMREVLRMALNVTLSNVTVLITGASGTGKEVIADFIQRHSARSERPFIKINCGAIPESLLESELFGHERGAFTDARTRRAGKFEEADGGTLFLDEIGEMSLSAQVKLLRVLQDGNFTRVGGNQIVKTDIRVMAATNQDLDKAIEEKRFRQDLYYRLNIFPIDIPPLAARREDIPLLVDHFLDRFRRRTHKYLTGISEEALSLLLAYDWPGNVRELENVVERAAIVATGRVITTADLPESFQSGSPGRIEPTIEIKIGTPLDEVKRTILKETLKFTGGHKTKAARLLGIDRKTFYGKV
jgi:two-component system response regulator HydG